MGATMQRRETHKYAQQLLSMHGHKAIVVVAKKAGSFEERGDSTEAQTWRHIEKALKLMIAATSKLKQVFSMDRT
jgi:hypothetical protein